MTGRDHIVSSHYDTGPILDRIKAGLRAAGLDPDSPSADDLKAVDEFHVGGAEATEAFLKPLEIGPTHRVVDLGSGAGGPARFIATRYGARVTGFDLTPAYVKLANTLSRMTGLQDRTEFHIASILDLPVAPGSFDLATMLHVGMNIEDKHALFREAARILAPGGRFAVYDLMAIKDGHHDFPVPWASDPAASHVAPPETYKAAAAAAGLRLVAETDRRDFALAHFDKLKAEREKAGGPPLLGIHLIMGSDAGERFLNLTRAVRSGSLGPREMVFELPA